MSYITSIGIASPAHRFDQSTIAGFMEQGMDLDVAGKRKLKAIFRASGIETRYSVLEDFGQPQGHHVFNNQNESIAFPTTQQRLKLYRKYALPLALQAVDRCFENLNEQTLASITHLIVVSCTGMYAPGLDIDLVKSLRLRDEVQRTCINFMGCYAAFNGLKIADALCKANPAARVLVVCVELCTLHFQREGTDDNLLANALFADGASAMLVSSTPARGWNLMPEQFHNGLAINGQEHMAWTIGDFGFEMKLSSYVPEVIRSGIRQLTNTMLQRVNKQLDEIKHFAIHPGGKKILEAIEDELDLSPEQNEPAYAVLKDYGNMSSVTIAFVLKQILNRLTQDDQHQQILGFAFGPGLTLESIMLKTEHHA
ncbi:MAG: type III polyketide synthase [Cyclobacteriaceae bacterium]|nr:type III polyketide synthase [Cyclobacteriaceae bacterium]